jgi:GT2 family glycosyltransferase
MPRFSLITPVYNPPADVLEAMLASVRAQTFADWEHCLVDDASPDPHVQEILQRAAKQDPRFRVLRREGNGGIVAASNDALACAGGEFVALLDHDDELHPDALGLVHRMLCETPEADYAYSDEDKIDEVGNHSAPFFKPDWSPERFRAQMYTCHFSVLRRSLVDEVGGFDPDYEGSQDWDLILKVTEKARAVVHVPQVLYSWRMLPGSTAGGGEAAKPYAFTAGTRALQAHCDRIGFEAEVVADKAFPGVHHLLPRMREKPPVSIIIPTAGTMREVWSEHRVLVTHCVRSIVRRSLYPNYEIVVVADPSVTPAVRAELAEIAGDRLQIVDFERPFHYSQKINVGALAASGDHFLMLNDDIEVITRDWIERLLMYSRHDGVGAVGAKLLFGDGRIQHAGVIFIGGGPGHTYRGFSRDYPGYAANALVPANFSAVTGACTMSPRAAFEEVGGLSQHFPVNFNDIDYCLKLQSRGYRVVLDPDTRLYHFESSSRSTDVAGWERELLRTRWGAVVDPDPFYNPNFGIETVDFFPRPYLSTGSLV